MKITPLVKLCILAAVGCGLYALWHKGVPHHQETPQATGETEVAVHVGKISLATLRHGVTAYGTVEPEPGTADKAPASARIASPVAAIVSDVDCFEGQQVEKGQTLFTLNNSRKPDGSIDQALLKITAPLSGTVVYVNVRPGEVTDPETQTPLVEVVDLNRLIIAANVPSSQIPAVKLGQTVEIVPQQGEVPDTFARTETATPNPAPVALTGTVTLIEDRVDPKTDMGPVDISVPTKARLRPGQFVRVRIITEERRDCLTVPSRSIVKNQSGEWVIYLVSGKQAIQQPVKVGFREGDRVQVQSLVLQPGDKVVTTGAYGLPGKTKIRILSE
ncbi:MAG: efflux RND transporter periplasmic adaptor subunit [Candidatus Udaeobacter sp.]